MVGYFLVDMHNKISNKKSPTFVLSYQALICFSFFLTLMSYFLDPQLSRHRNDATNEWCIEYP